MHVSFAGRVCACECSCLQKSEVLESLELELQAVLSCQMWLLGMELRPSVRAAHTLTTEASPQSLEAFINVFKLIIGINHHCFIIKSM